MTTSTEFVEISVTVLFTTLADHYALLEFIFNKSHFNAHTNPIFKDLGILKFYDIHLLQLGQFIYSCKNSFLPPRFNNNFSQSNSTLTTQEIPRPTVYRIVVQTLRSSRPFFKGLSFLIHSTMRSSTLLPFPLLRKN